MKAVFLDRNTLSERIDVDIPKGVNQWVAFQKTAPDEIVQRLKPADIAIVNKVKLDEATLRQLPNLKLIHLTATGMDNIDKEAAKALGIEVKNVAGYSTESVTEHFFLLLLSAMRALKTYHASVADGTWQKDGRFCLTEPPVLELHGKTLGIIGVGNIGKQITQAAKVFGMRVLWAERQGKVPRNDQYTEFDKVLAQSDIISINCPLTPETKHLVNEDFISKLRKKPLIINVARGAVVDPQAVYEAIESNRIMGFATDVFEQEPPLENDPLLKIANHPRVIYTPHIAWASEHAQDKLWRILKKQVEDFIVKYKAAHKENDKKA
ncbi:D-2-hydroxyacid dehydrogenase [Capnocytophaga sp. oral taxon 878]|uniref:D-2-hydroxyacid dehydrogenase n=1 Tax=Capnocytophaga sp. oral taxon 878 TaxID=1316596 RepID=UPI000D03FA31|nr:D-2-hydroxyacid dehydrogenase [Capnocytophaga sp. oral taxon 878]AVM49242.1 hydroxyacid dehydrogenase [Capnocytophaga sp. oral taxon 878]